MPTLKFFNLPQDETEEKLKELEKKLIATVTWINELGITDPKEVTCHFVSDLRTNLTNKITVEISGLYEKPKRTEKVLERLGLNVCKTIKKLYPEKAVDCQVSTLHYTIATWVCLE